MAQIAEDLYLLLLDNSSAQPGLDQPRRHRVLSGAVLLDLALACRIRPAAPGDGAPDGHLVALAGDDDVDPVSAPALELLRQHPERPAVVLSKLRKSTEGNLIERLERAGQLRRQPLGTKRFRQQYALPITDRARVSQARAEMLSALFDRRPPAPATAAIVTLLHTVDGLGSLMSLNDRGWRWVHARAGDIASGSWVNEYATGVPEVNLAVTAAAVRGALV
ncbi:GPP34 family phosphoprotein [Mycobacterium sp. CBMA 234]|uniref:GOLPH3/VPS74 family protein n=1 Tax=Mycolicibacterium sp. CBMA 234 TaxID=1918495 RepID=UPI0012DF2EE8|nr:GPP34 family phosphoprotein [Mycolicibacterium sp. CBMA 234]MUL66674.1 GPP34 family phosphoprotein [Mycolicibacterium sp. CBMA 234]